MTDKSHVSMETNQCLVCMKEFETGAILLDRTLRDRFERHTCTGPGLCEEHKKLHDDGYIALIEVSEAPAGESASLDEVMRAKRTGQVAHVRREAWEGLTDVECDVPVCLVEEGVIAKLVEMSGGAS